jgi:hypothetical protein
MYQKLMSSNVMRSIHVISLLVISPLAVFSLRGHQLRLNPYFVLGIFAILLPILCPFLVFFSKPCKPPNTAL